MKIPIEVSARHMHISQADLEALFGVGYKLKLLRHLTQQSDFAAQETLDIINKDRKLEAVRIIGPVRKYTQIEISKTDAIYLRLNPPVRMSGDIRRSSGAILKGPKGELKIDKGVVIAQRHIHCNYEEAKKLNLKNGEIVSVQVEGERSVIFNNVKVRINDDYKLSMQIDTDEGNACGINQEGEGVII